MPRNGAGVYSLPAGTADFTPSTVIESSKIDSLTADLELALNTAWPVSLGGTGGTSAITSWDAIAAAEDTVASAATLVLTALTKPFFNISGTTGVTAVTQTAGTVRIGRLTGATLTLAASATLIVEGQTSGTFNYAVNDVLMFEGYAGSTVRVWQIGHGGATRANDGTAALPGYTFLLDPDTGMYRIGANNIGWGVNGAIELDLNSTRLAPGASDGSALGSTSLMWADLFLADGGVMNWNAGNYTITHSAGDLAFSGIVTLPNTGLHLLDTNASHDLIIAPGSNITADRTLTITTGDASHTLDISGAPTNVVLATGSYTPTLFNGANVAASTAQVCRYSRIGDTVTVSGYFNVDATTTATLTTIGMSLPIASNLALVGDVGGTASSTTSESWAVFADTAGEVATMTTLVNTAAAHDVTFCFQYVIK